jgi:TonB-dependent SusC/RagA subfamily outer membrane receptor
MMRLTLFCAATALAVAGSPVAALPAVVVPPNPAPSATAAAVVSGRVTDATGRPLANAQVFIVGSQLRALSTAEGRFSIANVPDGTHTIRAMLIGFAPQSKQITVAGQPVTADFSLTAQTVQLEASSRSATDSSAVRTSRAPSRRSTSPTSRRRHAERRADARGRVAGAPGHAEQRRAGRRSLDPHPRPNSIAANSEPLYVIDGIPAITGTSSNDPYQNPLSSISPSDIENIEVLKDASSTAIYGARGRGGRGAHHHQARSARPEPRHDRRVDGERRHRRRRSRC